MAAEAALHNALADHSTLQSAVQASALLSDQNFVEAVNQANLSDYASGDIFNLKV